MTNVCFDDPLSVVPQSGEFTLPADSAEKQLVARVASTILLDNMFMTIGLQNAAMHSVLSRPTHVVWSLGIDGTLKNRPRYNKSVCFDPLPFPYLSDALRARFRTLGEDLDARRKRQQAANPKFTLTQMYIDLEKLRAGEPIEGKDHKVYDKGLVGIIKDRPDQIAAISPAPERLLCNRYWQA